MILSADLQPEDGPIGGWCGDKYGKLDREGIDHLCRRTRMRLGLLPPDDQLLDGVAPDLLGFVSSREKMQYHVRARRFDSFWKQELRSRHV